MAATIAVLRGDGIGPEVIEAALSVLGACVPVRVREGRVGGDAIDHGGDPLPPETLELCRSSDAVLLGAVGGPRWEGRGARRRTGCCACAAGSGSSPTCVPRATWACPPLCATTSSAHADILVVRDLAGGVYFGEPRGGDATEAFNTWRQTADQVRQVAHVAFRQAAPAPPQGHLRGQGQRAGGLAPVADAW